MSQVARAKKMFDDVSSDAESKTSNAAAATPPPPPSHRSPAAAEASVDGHVDPTPAESDAHAFQAKSASASQARADNIAPEQDTAESGATMVTRVEVSPPPKETAVVKHNQSPAPMQESATARKLTVHAGATPSKSTTTGAAGHGAAASSSYSTPATVSKRPMEREQREAEHNTHTDSGARRDRHGAAATKSARYTEREKAEDPHVDDVAFSTVGNAAQSRTTRGQRAKEASVQQAPYSATSGRKETAAQLDYSREEPAQDGMPQQQQQQRRHTSNTNADHAALLGREMSEEDEESEVEDFPFSTYVFPRLDPALADYHGSRTAVGAAKRGEECPPNACERCLAYLMVTDLRMAIYTGILLLSIVFVIVSIPTSQLDKVGKACFTYWGFKEDCDTATYTITRPLYPCSAIRSRLGAGAAFSIITLVLYVVNLTATIIAICCLKSSPHQISLTSRVVVGVIGGLLVITQLISWAVIAGIHSSHYCADTDDLAFGVGFGLNLTSWILNFLGVVLVVAIPSRLVNRHQRS